MSVHHLLDYFTKEILEPLSGNGHGLVADLPLTENKEQEKMPIQEQFSKMYGLLPANSPAKRTALLTLMKEYAKLSSSDRQQFDRWLLTSMEQ